MFTTTSKFYVKNSKDIKLGRYYYNVLRILVSRKIELAESKRYIKDSILANQWTNVKAIELAKRVSFEYSSPSIDLILEV